MQIKKGIAVSPGVAISRAVVIDAEDVAIPRRAIASTAVTRELVRLDESLEESQQDIKNLREQAVATVGEDLAKIFDAHLAMLMDRPTVAQIKHSIETELVTAEYAVYSVMRRLAQMFSGQENRYLRERANDIWDLERRILGHLIGHSQQELAHLESECILIAHDLTPSQTASLDKNKIKGIATDAGGRTSHTAILAHALGIPAVVGLEDITSSVNNGDSIILDGNRGQAVIDPNAEQLLTFREYKRRATAFESSLDELRQLPAQTTDGTSIALQANIEFPDEIEPALGKGATGIGLYRTEFLFLASEVEPTEEKQYESYRAAVEACNGLPLTIRTLDLGADKVWLDGYTDHAERNPFLGCRSIRLCLQHLPLFTTQLRAILRASVHGPIRIMFPLISNLMELRQAKMILADVMEDLEEQDIAFAEGIPVGMMVEVPSAAIQASVFAQEADFFSIGTNDLIQYTVAVDRGNERIANLYSAAHPAVISLVRDVVRAGKRAKIDVSLCGEMGGEPEYTMLLLGLGLRKLSITPPAIPEVKQIIRNVTIDRCKRVMRKVATFETEHQVLHYLRAEMRRVLPDAR
ncbi:MAG: phosphoenolpyruvate--protein phosphotransferase [Phycisphaeraceae bacterium]|nr:phosphoenolpyruvate--protein phosphotransferase [Phycisphaeraceae bacterium]